MKTIGRKNSVPALWRTAIPWRALLPGAAAMVSVALVSVPSGFLSGDATARAQSPAYVETFDGAPSAPTPYAPPGWDVAVHSRDRETLRNLEPMNAMHGADCGPPPATHPISDYEDAVFQCKDHLMTAIKAGGYGVIYLTPDQLLDFSQGEAVLKFDVSTLRTSLRDWFDIWVTPYQDNLELPIDDGFQVDLNGTPRNSVQIRMDQFNERTIFRPSVTRDFHTQDVKGANWWTGYESFLTPDAKRRDTFELHLSRTHIKFGMPNPMGDPSKAFWWVDQDISDLGWSQGVVQIGHHSYNPQKDCTPTPTACQPNTWHWGNVGLTPAVPFTIMRAQQRYVDATTSPQVTFPSSSPTGANLRFAGIGRTLDVSFDDGVTWQPSQVQPASRTSTEDHFRSYWMAIPAGTTSVVFRGTNWNPGPWMVRDISIWAEDAIAPLEATSSSDTTTPPTTTPGDASSNGASAPQPDD